MRADACLLCLIWHRLISYVSKSVHEKLKLGIYLLTQTDDATSLTTALLLVRNEEFDVAIDAHEDPKDGRASLPHDPLQTRQY